MFCQFFANPWLLATARQVWGMVSSSLKDLLGFLEEIWGFQHATAAT
jgi:hypothetical protein